MKNLFITQKKLPLLPILTLVCLLIFSTNTVLAQNTTQEKEYTVSGTVADENATLPGVNIVLQGTNIGTESDIDGNFEFPKTLKNGDVLVFSHLSMETKKVTIKSKDASTTIKMNVVMTSNSYNLLGAPSSKKVYSSKKK